MIKFYRSIVDSNVRIINNVYMSIYEDDINIWFERDNSFNKNKWKTLNACVFTTYLFPHITFYKFNKNTFKQIPMDMTLMEYKQEREVV